MNLIKIAEILIIGALCLLLINVIIIQRFAIHVQRARGINSSVAKQTAVQMTFVSLLAGIGFFIATALIDISGGEIDFFYLLLYVPICIITPIVMTLLGLFTQIIRFRAIYGNKDEDTSKTIQDSK